MPLEIAPRIPTTFRTAPDFLESTAPTTTAFALAGLGGFNAHGAGFLAAAAECEIAPDLVTATSGQIVVVADWLQGKDLEKSIVDAELEHNSMAQLAVALCGDPGVLPTRISGSAEAMVDTSCGHQESTRSTIRSSSSGSAIRPHARSSSLFDHCAPLQ